MTSPAINAIILLAMINAFTDVPLTALLREPLSIVFGGLIAAMLYGIGAGFVIGFVPNELHKLFVVLMAASVVYNIARTNGLV